MTELCLSHWGVSVNPHKDSPAHTLSFQPCSRSSNSLFWLCWASAAAHRLSLAGTTLLLQRTGFSLRRLPLVVEPQALRITSFSSCSLWALQCRGSRSCGSWAWLLRGLWNLPGLGIEPVSPGLADRFLSTVPPGKST